MKYLRWVVAILLVLIARGAYADSIPAFVITTATIFVSPGIDNAAFALTGPGTNISGFGGIACQDWCNFQSFPAGSISPVGFGLEGISLSGFDSAEIGGQNFDTSTAILGSITLNVSGGFTFPTNFAGQTFTACVPATIPGSITGSAGFGEGFTQFSLHTPQNGTFCSTWNFDAASGTFQFAQGKFVATTIPEPGTFSLVILGVLALTGATQRAGIPNRLTSRRRRA
jgi:hypothetical protein